MAEWLLALDDTDVVGTRGTGGLARMLAAELERRGFGRRGITRHQLLVHPSIPYTSHNSANCLGLEADGDDLANQLAWICRFVVEQCPDGSDPGVCIARAAEVSEAVSAFGRRAQQEPVRQAEAVELARREGVTLAGLGGTHDGVIGALAAVGLRASGADGRFVELGAIREIDGRVQVRRLLEAGADAVECEEARQPQPEDWVETLGWARPRLVGGRAVLIVERSNADGVDWIVADRRRHRAGGGVDSAVE